MTKINKDFINNNGGFVFKSHSNEQKDSGNEINDSDMVRLAYSATYVDYDGILKLDTGAIINKRVLAQLININRNIFYIWYNKMVEHNIFIENSDNTIFLNEKYYTKGIIKIENNSYTRVLINTMRKLYEENCNKNISTLGNLFKLIPYMHYKYNVLCWNPKNAVPRLMRVREMLELIGMDTCHIIRNIKKLNKYEIDGEPVFLFITDYIHPENDKILINPKLLFSGKTSQHDETVLFFQHCKN